MTSTSMDTGNRKRGERERARESERECGTGERAEEGMNEWMNEF